jgi:hypothetical protein
MARTWSMNALLIFLSKVITVSVILSPWRSLPVSGPVPRAHRTQIVASRFFRNVVSQNLSRHPSGEDMWYFPICQIENPIEWKTFAVEITDNFSN